MRMFIADSLYFQQYLSKDKAIIGRSGNGGVPERLNDMRKQTADKPFQSGKRPSESLKYGFQTAFYFYGRAVLSIFGEDACTMRTVRPDGAMRQNLNTRTV